MVFVDQVSLLRSILSTDPTQLNVPDAVRQPSSETAHNKALFALGCISRMDVQLYTGHAQHQAE